MFKKSYFGAPAYSTTASNPYADFSKKDLKRIGRTLARKGIKSTDYDNQTAITDAVHKVKKSIPINKEFPDKVDINVSPFSVQDSTPTEINVRQKNSIVAGHELGHVKDVRTREREFFGDRGLFGIGRKPETILKPEASASQQVIKGLPRGQRDLGLPLANAYDTYRYNARFALSPQEESRNAELYEKISKGIRREASPSRSQQLSKLRGRKDAILGKIVDNLSGVRKHTSQSEGILRNILESSTIRENKHLRRMEAAQNRINARNRTRLVKNLEGLSDLDKAHARQLLQSEVADTRRLFGKEIAHSYQQQFFPHLQSTVSPTQKPLKNVGSSLKGIVRELKNLRR